MIRYTFDKAQRPLNRLDEKINPICLDILYRRGFSTEEAMRQILFPDLREAIGPFQCRDIDATLDILEQKEPTVVYRDYDVDGIAAGAVAVYGLCGLGVVCHHYANEREIDGYGICRNGIDEILRRWPETRVILTVDNGISGMDAISYAKSLGLKVIVTDHHTVGDALPDADAVIDLKRKDEMYPFRDLCGCGVIFRVMLELYRRMHKKTDSLLKLLDIVALATVADVVPLLGENRTIVKHGLALMESGVRPFFRALARNRVTAQTVGFQYAPLLNALSRMGYDTDIAVDALLCEDYERVQDLIEKLTKINQDRKEETEKEYMIAQRSVDCREKAIVLKDDAFSEGIIGIVAGRLKEKYHRPVILFSKSANGVLKGSGRSIDGFPLYEKLALLSDNLLSFGGHTKAAGLSLEESRFQAFAEALLALADVPQEVETIPLAAILEEKDVTEELVLDLRMLEPYGEGFPAPVFGLKAECSSVQCMGSEGQHLKFITKDSGLPIIAWNSKPGRKIAKKFIGTPELHEWKGTVSVQFICAEGGFYG